VLLGQWIASFEKVCERPVIHAYEANVAELHVDFWEEIKIMMGFKYQIESEHVE